MSYYKAGDYYRRGDLGGAIQRFTGGLSSALSKVPAIGIPAALASKVVSTVAQKPISLIPEDQNGGRRYRRMNPLNPRALRRSLRRIQGFARFAKKVMHFAHPKPRSTRFRFPKRRRRT